MKTLGYLVECQGRSLFIRDRSEVQWAIDDENYKVTELVPKTDETDTEERLQILEEIYELEEKEISTLKEKLEDAVELIEVIYEFSSKDTNNLLEAKGLLHLVAEACGKWLAPK